MDDEPKADTPESAEPETPAEVPVPIEQVVMSHEQRLQLIFKGYTDLHERLRKVELRLGVKPYKKGELIT
jgi:hypothetical protein